MIIIILIIIIIIITVSISLSSMICLSILLLLLPMHNESQSHNCQIEDMSGTREVQWKMARVLYQSLNDGKSAIDCTTTIDLRVPHFCDTKLQPQCFNQSLQTVQHMYELWLPQMAGTAHTSSCLWQGRDGPSWKCYISHQLKRKWILPADPH